MISWFHETCSEEDISNYKTGCLWEACIVTHILPCQMRAVWARSLNFLPLPFRPSRLCMWVCENCHLPPYPFLCYPGPLRYVFVCGRLSGYFMWHTWRSYLRSRFQTLSTASVWLQCDSGIGLIAQIDGLFFTLEKRLPEEHWKANESLNLEL